MDLRVQAKKAPENEQKNLPNIACKQVCRKIGAGFTISTAIIAMISVVACTVLLLTAPVLAPVLAVKAVFLASAAVLGICTLAALVLLLTQEKQIEKIIKPKSPARPKEEKKIEEEKPQNAEILELLNKIKAHQQVIDELQIKVKEHEQLKEQQKVIQEMQAQGKEVNERLKDLDEALGQAKEENQKLEAERLLQVNELKVQIEHSNEQLKGVEKGFERTLEKTLDESRLKFNEQIKASLDKFDQLEHRNDSLTRELKLAKEGNQQLHLKLIEAENRLPKEEFREFDDPDLREQVKSREKLQLAQEVLAIRKNTIHQKKLLESSSLTVEESLRPIDI